MSITAKEIAKMLNVSPSTVSLALNGKPGVSDVIRETIISTASKYNYAVRQRQNSPTATQNIRYVIYIGEGRVVNEISFSSIVLRGIESKAKELGYNVLISYFYKNQDETDQLKAIFQNTSGIILLGTELDESSGLLDHPIVNQNPDVPIVVVDTKTFHSEVDCIFTDNLRGAYKAIEYLINQNHTRIGYFSSIQRILNFDERSEGVHRAIADYPKAKLEVVHVGFSSDRAFHDICDYLKSNRDIPTAFFADSDVIAFGAIQAFNVLGLNVPNDVSVIGFDDMPASEMVCPPLTTIKVMKVLMGSKAMELLDQRIQDKTSIQAPDYRGVFRTAISTDIVVRKSVSPYVTSKR